MNPASGKIRGRLAELLAGEAVGDLDAAERAELERLAATLANDEREELLQTAALAQVALCRRDRAARSLPPALKLRLERQAAAWTAGHKE